MKAKDTSHIGMIVGAVCLFIAYGACICKLLITDTFSISLEQAIALIILGISPSIPFCPIYISTWLDKLFEWKFGKKTEE